MKKAVVALLFAVAIIVGVVVGRVQWAEHNTALIEQGRSEMREQYARELDLNARIKRDMATRISEGVKQGVSDYAARFQAEQADRKMDDEIAKSRVEALISIDPEYYTNRLCVIPDQMLAERNRIRHNNTEK